MSIEELARAATVDLRTRTAADLEAGLDAVLATHSRRHRRSRVTIALAAAAAVAAAWWGGASLGGHAGGPEPAPAPTVPVPRQSLCQSSMVTCLGTPRTYGFALDVPVTWHVPRGYGVDSGAGATTQMVESYWRHHGNAAGVTVLEGVSAPSRTGDAALRGGPTTANGFVHWLAARPYLVASTPRRTTIDGRPGWQVRVSLKPHAGAGPGRCAEPIEGFRCYPVTYQDVRTITGIWGDMVADYTAFDLPGSGTAVVWSWAFGRDAAALDRNQQLVGGLSWPRH